MISIKSTADIARALSLPIDAELKRLLALRRDQLLAHYGYDLGELAHFVVVEPRQACSGKGALISWGLLSVRRGDRCRSHGSIYRRRKHRAVD